jgi:hypothetical protein
MTSALRILEDLLMVEKTKLPSYFYTSEDVTNIEKEIVNLTQTKQTFCEFLKKLEDLDNFCYGCVDGCDICNEHEDESEYLKSLYKVNNLVVHNFDKDIDRLKCERESTILEIEKLSKQQENIKYIEESIAELKNILKK